ncbi:MAG TPA: hypothetical protein VM925_25705 [Labilithrix sp.]|nr:hypothetical protein [Labilithrix sp.]
MTCPGIESFGIDLAPKGYCALSCGDQICDAVTEYCVFGSGGQPGPDGGVSTHYACTPYPTQCEVEHTCACVAVHSGSTPISCTDGNYRVTMEIPAP